MHGRRVARQGSTAYGAQQTGWGSTRRHRDRVERAMHRTPPSSLLAKLPGAHPPAHTPFQLTLGLSGVRQAWVPVPGRLPQADATPCLGIIITRPVPHASRRKPPWQLVISPSHRTLARIARAQHCRLAKVPGGFEQPHSPRPQYSTMCYFCIVANRAAVPFPFPAAQAVQYSGPG